MGIGININFNPCIVDANYDFKKMELIISFKTSGKKYLYKTVPASIYYGLNKSLKPATYYIENIKGKFRSELLTTTKK